MKTKKKKIAIEKRQARSGFLFTLPWLIGFIYFFGINFIKTMWYSVSKVDITNDGFKTTFKGLAQYRKLFYEDPDFVRVLTGGLKDLVIQVPIIIFFSIFIAVILNQDFKGRGFARALFFLPVIISSGVVLEIIGGSSGGETVMGSASKVSYLMQTVDLKGVLLEAGLSLKFVEGFMNVLNQIFSLIWISGVQILIFLSALQSVPRPLYEASEIEGATRWESFWKITFPMISPMILVNVVYTIIDISTSYSNKVMRLISKYVADLNYEYSSAMGFIYFIVVFLIVTIVGKIISKRVYYMTD